MTITQVVNVERVAWQGFRNPGLPTGVWKANWGVVGDGSGGDRRIECVFKGAASRVPNQMYSLEHTSMSDNSNVDSDVELATDGFAHTFGSDWGCFFRLKAGRQTGRLNIRDMVALRGSFLGEINKTAAATVHLVILINNVTSQTFAGAVAGFIWGPEAKTIAGGPQRPGGGVFPS